MFFVLLFLFYILFFMLLQLFQFFSLCLLHPVPPPLTPTVNPQVYGSYIYVIWLIPSPSFNQSPLPLTLLKLSVCSTFLCLCFYFSHQFILLIRFHMQVRSHGICLSLTGLFHLALQSPGPSMLLQKVRVPSFLLLCNIPLCTSPQLYLSTPLLMGTQAVSRSWLL